jgi:small nuclear ribonucleoprotein (snRNP)-like protein
MIIIISGRQLLSTYLNKNMKIKLTDGRILLGIFLCTDKDVNVILGTCAEYLSDESAERALNTNHSSDSEPRMLGLAMVPGRHILTIHVDDSY